jgi:F-type H+-transporting ATPase subunit delta|tara:strand:+ start:1613 stop:2170 length:558 start_codon:yes stop_codon:yes gene_type:complete
MASKKSFSTETSNRYARAIFQLAKENNELEIVEENIKEFLKVYKSNLDLQNFIKNPTETVSNQLKVISKISDAMNLKKIFKNFLSILVVKRRIFFIKKILESFINLSANQRGELSAKLISSKVLSAKELENVSSELSESIGSDISFDYTVDDNLIGGFKMQLGSLMIDTSIQNRLKKYEQIMLEK